MHIEFQYLIADLLAKFAAENPQLLPSLVKEELEQTALKVEDSPRQIDADLMCDFCFSWAKLLPEKEKQPIRPEDLAQRALSYLGAVEIYRRDDFDVTIAGLGFFNASAKESLTIDMLKKCHAFGGHLFFSEDCFLSVTPIAESDSLMEKLRSAFLARDYSRERFVTSHNENVRELIKALPTELNAEHRLMLLATLTDPELDFGVYLKGIGGSENVPWLLRKFYQDQNSFRQQISARFSLEQWVESNTFDPIEGKAIRLILRFRYVLAQAQTLHRPELLVAQAIGMAKAFYEIYHHPRGRSFCAGTINYQLLYYIVETLALLVWGTLNILGSSEILFGNEVKL